MKLPNIPRKLKICPVRTEGDWLELTAGWSCLAKSNALYLGQAALADATDAAADDG